MYGICIADHWSIKQHKHIPTANNKLRPTMNTCHDHSQTVATDKYQTKYHNSGATRRSKPRQISDPQRIHMHTEYIPHTHCTRHCLSSTASTHHSSPHSHGAVLQFMLAVFYHPALESYRCARRTLGQSSHTFCHLVLRDASYCRSD